MSIADFYKLLLIGIGGGIGAVLRYLVMLATGTYVTSGFPLGTLLVNVIGSAGLGFLAVALSGPVPVSDATRAALLIGLLGGFTTFSTFAFENLRLGHDGQWLVLAANLVLNNGAALLAAWGGYRLAQQLFPETPQ